MAEPVADINGLSFTYSGSGSPALENINLQIYPGQFLTVTGPSGCGKSTLALCLAGFIPHAYAGKMEGSVRIQGKNTRDYPAGGLSGIVGLVQQDPEAQLCTLTVCDEVAFGPENLCIPAEEIRERVYSSLKAVGALELIDRQVHTLSGGEKQRVAIASVLAMNPALLILDEPTANLDPSCTREVLETLNRLKENHDVAIIVIEHRLERLLPISDRFLLMENGKIAEESASSEPYKRYITSNHVLLNNEPEPQGKDTADYMKAAEGSPLLLVKNLKAGYEGRDVITDVSFCAFPGETIAVMGSNGSGKTTLLMALLGVLKQKEGIIFLHGKDIVKQKVTRRARDMGLTFQNPNHQIFENTVFKEAKMASRFLSDKNYAEIEFEVSQLLHEFDLQQYRDKNPFSLSLGEKKRLNLISVLAYSPRILILDEPIVGQDSGRLALLVNALQKHSEEGGITLMVCHEPDVVAACCQRVLFFSQGKLIIDAPVKGAWEILAQLGMNEYLPSTYETDMGGKVQR
ncbi:MAG TPA: ATP-binding cassette domain-containing protein [Chitinophagaceae bacterium]|nr:ATP-binding cassette domain-containing protein [Chitinophagaceae bacterium]